MTKLSDTFLPGEPSGGGGKFLNLKKLKEMKDRTIRFRILTPFITGHCRFKADKRPLRVRLGGKFPSGVQWGLGFDGTEQQSRPFWAAFVWSEAGGIQVFEFQQGSVHRQLKELVNEAEWGIPTGYDVRIKSTGEGKDTEYSVLPCPKALLPKAAAAEWEAFSQSCAGLDALYSGGDPFAPFGEDDGAPQAPIENDEDIPF